MREVTCIRSDDLRCLELLRCRAKTICKAVYIMLRERRLIRSTCCTGGVHSMSAMLRKEKGMGRASEGWRSMPLKSTVRASSRGGVPVFSRDSRKPSASSVFASDPADIPTNLSIFLDTLIS